MCKDAAEVAARSMHSSQRSDEMPFTVGIAAVEGHKCERCWHFSEHLGESERYPGVCPRCVCTPSNTNNPPPQNGPRFIHSPQMAASTHTHTHGTHVCVFLKHICDTFCRCVFFPKCICDTFFIGAQRRSRRSTSPLWPPPVEEPQSRKRGRGGAEMRNICEHERDLCV